LKQGQGMLMKPVKETQHYFNDQRLEHGFHVPGWSVKRGGVWKQFSLCDFLGSLLLGEMR